MSKSCRHLSRKIGPTHPLAGKTVYIPTMADGSAEAFAAVFRWLGVGSLPTPPSDERTRELGARYTNGDECYPAKVVAGDFLRVIEQPGFDPKHTMFFMPTADGPCRFGQYAPMLEKVLRENGYGDVQILSPTSKNSYADLGEISTPFMRAGWRALVAASVLRKALHRTRPFETTPGSSDKAYEEGIADLCSAIENGCSNTGCQLDSIVEVMKRAREKFRAIVVRYDESLPLIGVVGEIFCRLNTFSNEDLIRKLEAYGARAWLSDIPEWIMYTNSEQVRKLKLLGRTWSKQMLMAHLRRHIQERDEHAILEPFKQDFIGCEEPDVYELFEYAEPYLPNGCALGEMVLSVGKAAYLAKHGADGIIDISPFTCMNGIVSEAVYPKLSKDYGGIPIRNFYFDGTQSELDRDLGIYMELARSYREASRTASQPPAISPSALSGANPAMAARNIGQK
jgi:predicted nucleotide-binding protein (sugar kinase/HSP70/actin superfamily)